MAVKVMRIAAFGVFLAVLPFAAQVHAHPPVARQIERVTAELARSGDPALLLDRADLHRIAGHADEAERDCREALRLDPGLTAAHLCLARVALDRGDAAVAETEAREHLVHGDSAAGYRALAGALALSGQVPAALEAWRRAAETAEPPDPGDYLELAALHTRPGGGGADSALAALDAGTARLGSVVVFQAAAVPIARDAGRFDDALRRVDAILRAVPRAEAWPAERGRILLAAGRRPEAWAAFSDALAAIERLPAHHRSTPAIRELEAELTRQLQHPDGGDAP